MATVAQKLITAEEYAQMPGPPDGAKTELVRGEIVKVCRPGFQHGRRQVRISRLLDEYGESHRHGRAVVETGFVTEREPDTVRGPDVSYWSFERLPEDQEPEGYPELAPDLAIEVLSRNNRTPKIREKMDEYFRRGVKMVWIVDPEDRTVTVYRSLDEGKLLHEKASLSGEDVLPGFTLSLKKLFAKTKRRGKR